MVATVGHTYWRRITVDVLTAYRCHMLPYSDIYRLQVTTQSTYSSRTRDNANLIELKSLCASNSEADEY